MKAVELLKQWKPKKPKKQPDPWFFVWGWGTGETTELPSVSEGKELFVSNEHLYNPLKLRWWVINRLIEMNVLPSKTSNHAN